MVRRSTVERGPQPAAHIADFAAGTRDLEQNGQRPRASRGWGGAGGRWLVWTFRALIWAVLLIIGYRGVMAIVLNETPPSRQPVTRTAPAAQFPQALAAAFALEFGQAYLNASPATAAARAGELAHFLPPGADPQLGWNRVGSLQLQSEEVAGVKVRGAHHATVTLLARVNGNLMELGVPLFVAGSRIVVSGEPAWLPAPGRAVPPSPPVAAPDAAAQAALMNQLPAFFSAYASGSKVTLARFLVPGAVVNGLNGAVSFASLTGVTVPPGGPTRHVIATVIWRVPAPAAGNQQVSQPRASLEMSYELTIMKQNGSWYVKSISPAIGPGGPP